MSPSKTLFFLCIAFISGIFIESIIKVPQIFICGILFFGIITLVIALAEQIFPYVRQQTFFRLLVTPFVSVETSGPRPTNSLLSHILVVGFCLLFLVLGILRVQISEFNVAHDKLSKLNDKGKIILTGVISNEPDVRDTIQQIKVKVGESTILVTTKKYPDYKYLDTIKITGKLETPSVTDTFNYKNYLLKDHIYSVMSFPIIEIVSQKHNYNVFSLLYEKIIFFKGKVRENIRSNFLPPQSSILEGTVLGDNGAMTPDLKVKLNATGLRHIIAVSGTHVVILSSVIMSLLLALGFWRKQAFYLVIVIIVIYIVLTGLPSSGVRAGIMGGAYLLSQVLGRQSMGLRLITISCAMMLLINPLLLLYDVGFQLSFLAVLGLILVDPLIKLFIKKFFN